jgi:XTP/dITP diphosphohydrolase
MKDVEDDKRQGRFVCAMALAVPAANVAVMVDRVDGMMLREHRGTKGFGYASLFVVPQVWRTRSELEMQEKSRISHRGKALRRMIGWMRENQTALLAGAK